MPEQTTVLITGGAGFLGRALVRELVEPRGDAILTPREVRIFDRHEPSESTDGPIRTVVADLRDRDALRAACEGVDLVFHAAAVVDWGQHDRSTVEAVNVGGTWNALDACRAAGVRALVYTSTEDVVYGGHPIVDGDEKLPYPKRFASTYCATKAAAEQAVLAADGAPLEEPSAGRLRTCAIRPVGIWGEGDPHHISSLLRTAIGRRIVRVGSGRARFSYVYAGNVAHAHLLAARNLLKDGASAGGQVYLCTDYPPANFFDGLAPVFAGLGYELTPRWLHLPMWPMMALGAAVEGVTAALRPVVRLTPALSRFAVRLVCQDFTFRSDKARRELGYEPIYGFEEAVERTVAWFREHGPAPPSAR